MLKIKVVRIPEYSYNSEHKGAPFMVNGKYCNFGNLSECVCNYHYTGVFGYDTNAVPFDEGSDIETLGISVKSSGASLACLYGADKNAIIDEYFSRVHSTRWAYVVSLDSEWIIYEMNATEFRMFLDEWAGLAVESGKVKRYKVRIKKTSGKMLEWLDERVG